MSVPAAQDVGGATVPLHFTGRDAVFHRLVTRGALLELVTFGFYRFWLITDIRRHLWSHTEIAGDPMEYTGRAKEMLFGFLVATAILGPVFLVYFLIGLEIERFKEFGSLPLYLFLFAFGQFAVYRARRYRLTRTVWRGVRFWMTGSGWSYAGRSIAWGLLLLPTLGFAYPWRLAALERYKLRHTHYGSLPGRFEGTGWRLFQRIWWVWLLGLLPFLTISVGQIALVIATSEQPAQVPLAAAAVGILLMGVLMLVAIPFLHAVRRAREWAWWAGGIRFGGVEVSCALKWSSLIGTYWTLLGLVALVVFSWAAVVGGFTGALLTLAGGRDAIEGLMRGPFAIVVIAGYVASYLLMLLALGRFTASTPCSAFGDAWWTLAPFSTSLPLQRSRSPATSSAALARDWRTISISAFSQAMQPAVFFDGRSNRRHLVVLNFGERLDIADAATPDGAPLASWPYDALRRMDGPEDVLRLACTTAPALARLELRDPEAQADILRRCPALQGPGSTAAVSTWRIAAASIAAAAAILAMIWFGIPLVADRLAAIIPSAWEKPLGDAIDPQLRSILGPVCDSTAGTAALQKMVDQLQGAAQLQNNPVPLVLRSGMRNALALPGGRIYLLSGLLAKAQTPDELAGVLSHELGHVAHRDGLRNLIREGGTSFLVGFLFGDIAGAGVVLMAGRLVLSAAYSREAEEQADAFAVQIMQALGRPPAPLGALLERITRQGENGASILDSHPLTPDRKAMLEAAAQPVTGPRLLDEAEWRVLKRICDR